MGLYTLSACCIGCHVDAKSEYNGEMELCGLVIDDVKPLRNHILVTSAGHKDSYTGFIFWMQCGHDVGIFIDEIRIHREHWGIFIICSDSSIVNKELVHACWESDMDPQCNQLLYEGTSRDQDRFHRYMRSQGSGKATQYAVVGLTCKDGTHAQVIAYNYHDSLTSDVPHTVRFEFNGNVKTMQI